MKLVDLIQLLEDVKNIDEEIKHIEISNETDKNGFYEPDVADTLIGLRSEKSKLLDKDICSDSEEQITRKFNKITEQMAETLFRAKFDKINRGSK